LAVLDRAARHARRAFVLTFLLMSGCTAANAPQGPDGPAPDAAPATPVIEQALRTPPEVKAPKPDELIGLGGGGIVKAFGPASLKRRDLGAEIWQYRADTCVLFLFLYPEAGKSVVRHIEARGAAPETCIRAVVRAAQSGSG
jgi:hypothetical protein